MRKRRNGFTKFMCKLDGKPTVSGKVDTSRFTIPESLMIGCVELTLDDIRSNNGTRYLSSCFSWESSPQGFEYWFHIDAGETEIDQEGIDYLNWLVEQYT